MEAKKKLSGIFVITLLIASLLPVVNSTDSGVVDAPDYRGTEVIDCLEYDDNGTEVLDQEQPRNDRFGAWVHPSFYLAQSFKPSLTELTRVKLRLWKDGNVANDTVITVSIRDSFLGGEDLTYSTATASLLSFEHTRWLTFSFPKTLSVTPDKTYNIVCISDKGSDGNCVFWARGDGDCYGRGSPWYSYDNGFSWHLYQTTAHPKSDFCFKTYGLDYPPEPPVIDGSVSAGYYKEYTYTLNATDPEGHDVFYFVDWGDESDSDWLGPYPSGTLVTLNHSFFYHSDTGKQCIIRAKAKDIFDVEGDWATLEISMPKNIDIHTLFLQFLENHPPLFPILRQILLYRG